MLEQKELIEAYIYHRTGEKITIDLSQVSQSPKQLSMFFHAFRIAYKWMQLNAVRIA